MAKTQPPGEIEIPGVGTFAANAVPDPFDARDLEYRPKLEPLPRTIDQRAGNVPRRVLTQKGESCTGHALAAVIEAVLAQPARMRVAQSRNGSSNGRRRPSAPARSARTCSTASPAGTTSSRAKPTPARRSAARSRAGSTTASRARGEWPALDMAPRARPRRRAEPARLA